MTRSDNTRLAGRVSGPSRSPILTSLTLVVCMAVVVALLSGITTPLPKASLQGKVHLTSAGAASYQPAELWDGGSPDEPCTVCTVSGLVGEDTGQSTKSNQPVNPAIGDFTTTNTLFSIQSTGGTLDTTLSYDSEAASATAATGGIPGYFGYGWQSTISSSATINGYGQVTVDQPNGAEVQFNPDTNDDGCPTPGQYQDFQKYTVPNSQTPYCATSRLDAQLGYFGGYGYQVEEGDGSVTGYAWTGQLAYTGTRNLPEVNVFNYNVSPNAPNCPNAGESSCFIETNQSSGQKIDAQVDVYGLVQEVDDTIGHAWGMTYDNNADLASVTNQGTGGQTGYTYTTTATSPYNHNMQTLVNPLGGTESIHYYAYSMVQWVASPLGGTTNYNYSATDCATVAGCMGESQTTMVSYPDHEVDGDYYLFGTLEQTAFGPATTFNSPGDELWIFSPSYPSNQDGWMDEGVTLPGGSTATIITDAVGNVVTYTDPKGNVTNSMYNDTGGNDLDELCWTAMPGVSVPSNASCSNPPAGSTHYTYDAYGDQLSKTDPLGNTTYSGYYTDGDLCWTAQPTVGNGSACGNIGTSPSGAPAGSTVYTYSNGNVATKTVAYGTTFAQETQTSYDGESQINYTIPPDGISAGGFGSNAYETANTYHAYGELLSSTAPLGRVTTYTYNPAGGVLTETDPGGVTTNTYDVDGRTCWTLRATAASAATSRRLHPTRPAAPAISTLPTPVLPRL